MNRGGKKRTDPASRRRIFPPLRPEKGRETKAASGPEIKICGVRTPEQALACADMGADAVGLVFFEKSPRNVSPEAAAEICAALDGCIATVAVCVNRPAAEILSLARRVGFSMVQLHGMESPEDAAQVKAAGPGVLKALYTNKEPFADRAGEYIVDGYVVEAAGGSLPGGNALVWDWSSMAPFGENFPLILAGGLSPDTVSRAVQQARPWAVDVSSGVEASPGVKDMDKVAAFIRAARG